MKGSLIRSETFAFCVKNSGAKRAVQKQMYSHEKQKRTRCVKALDTGLCILKTEAEPPSF